MDKSPDAFRTISEVAEHLETPAHVLRFWESRFPQIRPVKRAGGRRYYRPSDVSLLTGIKRLLHDEGMTIRGVQKILREQGVRHVAGLSGDAQGDDAADDDAPLIDHPGDVVVNLKSDPMPIRPAPDFASVPATDTAEHHPAPPPAPAAPEPVQGALLLTPAPEAADKAVVAASPGQDVGGAMARNAAAPDIQDDVRDAVAQDAALDDGVPPPAQTAPVAEPEARATSARPRFAFLDSVVEDDDFGDDDFDDVAVTTLAARIRSLPPDASANKVKAELVALTSRLQGLRDRMAEAARIGRS